MVGEAARLRPMDYAGAGFGPHCVQNEAWWTRTRRIRTTAAMPLEVPILEIKPPPVYQRIALSAKRLHELGMTQAEIGRRLGVDRWTVGKALRWLGRVARG